MPNPVWQDLAATGYGYPFQERQECLALLKREPTVLLDIGCGSGGLGHAVRQRHPSCETWGCELDPSAARLAREHFDHVVEQDVEAVDFGALGLARPFDAVTMFDVLEHLVNPWQLLLRIGALLAPDAQVIVSLPNAQNLLVLLDAASGHWRYRRRGLLDITHLRFFTDFDARKMFYQTGYRVERHEMNFLGFGSAIVQKYHKRSFPFELCVDDMSYKVRSQRHLMLLCADQNLYAITPHHGELRDEQERMFASSDYPATRAFGQD